MLFKHLKKKKAPALICRAMPSVLITHCFFLFICRSFQPIHFFHPFPPRPTSLPLPPYIPTSVSLPCSVCLFLCPFLLHSCTLPFILFHSKFSIILIYLAYLYICPFTYNVFIFLRFSQSFIRYFFVNSF